MSSRDYQGRKIIVYPEYLDSSLTRGKGRRLNREKLVPKPSVEELLKAAETLGLNPILEEKNYPREWWKKRKRIVVDKKETKRKTLYLIAEKIRELRKEKK